MLFLLLFVGPTCQVERLDMNESQPLFLSRLGPLGSKRVAVSTCPSRRPVVLQVLESWLGPTPWPCDKQKPPMTHLFLTADWSTEMRRSSFFLSLPGRCATLCPLPPPPDPLNSPMSFLISAC